MKELSAAEASASPRVPVAADATTGPEEELPAIDLRPLTDGIALLGQFDSILAELTSSLGGAGCEG